jgi:hypothetical protein
MICFKLLRHKRRMDGHGRAYHDSGAAYISIISILVESAAVYAASCVIWAVLSFTGNPAGLWFNGVVASAAVCMIRIIVCLMSADTGLPVLVSIMDYPSHLHGPRLYTQTPGRNLLPDVGLPASFCQYPAGIKLEYQRSDSGVATALAGSHVSAQAGQSRGFRFYACEG